MRKGTVSLFLRRNVVNGWKACLPQTPEQTRVTNHHRTAKRGTHGHHQKLPRDFHRTVPAGDI